MKSCINCGKEYEVGTKTCQSCGEKVEKDIFDVKRETAIKNKRQNLPLLIGFALVILLGTLITVLKPANEMLEFVEVIYNNGETFVYVDELIIEISDEEEEFIHQFKVGNDVLLANADNVYIYDLKTESLTTYNDIRIYSISNDYKSIVVLTDNEELYYGDIFNPTEIKMISDNVMMVDTKHDFSEMIVIDSTGKLQLLSMDGLVKETVKEDVYSDGVMFVHDNIVLYGNENDELVIYDFINNKEIYAIEYLDEYRFYSSDKKLLFLSDEKLFSLGNDGLVKIDENVSLLDSFTNGLAKVNHPLDEMVYYYSNLDYVYYDINTNTLKTTEVTNILDSQDRVLVSGGNLVVKDKDFKVVYDMNFDGDIYLDGGHSKDDFIAHDDENYYRIINGKKLLLELEIETKDTFNLAFAYNSKDYYIYTPGGEKVFRISKDNEISEIYSEGVILDTRYIIQSNTLLVLNETNDLYLVTESEKATKILDNVKYINHSESGYILIQSVDGLYIYNDELIELGKDYYTYEY